MSEDQTEEDRGSNIAVDGGSQPPQIDTQDLPPPTASQVEGTAQASGTGTQPEDGGPHADDNGAEVGDDSIPSPSQPVGTEQRRPSSGVSPGTSQPQPRRGSLSGGAGLFSQRGGRYSQESQQTQWAQSTAVTPNTAEPLNLNQPRPVLDIFRRFVDVVRTESAFPELLPSWFGNPTHLCPTMEKDAVSKFFQAWKETQNIVANAPVSLDTAKCARWILNEAVERRLMRVIQVYQLRRVHKLFNDPATPLEMHEANPMARLYEENEIKLAEAWKAFAEDRSLFMPELDPVHIHVTPSDGRRLEREEFMRELERTDLDVAARGVLDEDLKGIEQRLQSAELPPAQVFYTSEAFRTQVFKGRFRARL